MEIQKLLGPLYEIYKNPNVVEIFVDHFDDVYHELYDPKTKQVVFVDRPDVFKSNEEILDIITRVAKKFGKDTDKDHFFSVNLDDQTVFKAVLPPLSVRAPFIYIFKIPQNQLGFKDLVKFGAVSEDGAKKIKDLVKADKSIIIAGMQARVKLH